MDSPVARLEHSSEELVTHPPDACNGGVCCIHNPSDHSMRSFRQHWRDDRGLMERICPHGIGHPDPDDLAWIAKERGYEAAGVEAVHGCDGCCREEGSEP